MSIFAILLQQFLSVKHSVVNNMLYAKGDLNELCIKPENCQVWNMVHSTLGGFAHCWVQGDKNRPSLGRKQVTSTSQSFVVFSQDFSTKPAN